MQDIQKQQSIKGMLQKMKLQDMGEKIKKVKGLVASTESRSAYYPTLYLSTKQLSDLKGYGLQDKCLFVVEGSIVGCRKDSYSDSEKFDIEIKKMALVK